MSKSTNLFVVFLLCIVLCVSLISGKVLKVPSEHPTVDVAIDVATDGERSHTGDRQVIARRLSDMDRAVGVDGQFASLSILDEGPVRPVPFI